MNSTGTFDRTPPKKEQRVRLNVGGVAFETCQSTLARCPYFERMFSGDWPLERDPNDASSVTLFLDRNPTSFSYVLDYLRGYPLRPDGRRLRLQVASDLDFLGLPLVLGDIDENGPMGDEKLEDYALHVIFRSYGPRSTQTVYRRQLQKIMDSRFCKWILSPFAMKDNEGLLIYFPRFPSRISGLFGNGTGNFATNTVISDVLKMFQICLSDGEEFEFGIENANSVYGSHTDESLGPQLRECIRDLNKFKSPSCPEDKWLEFFASLKEEFGFDFLALSQNDRK